MDLRNRKLPKLNKFPDIYDAQIFTMICINYRSVNVRRQRKAAANKNVLMFWSISTKIKDVRIC